MNSIKLSQGSANKSSGAREPGGCMVVSAAPPCSLWSPQLLLLSSFCLWANMLGNSLSPHWDKEKKKKKVLLFPYVSWQSKVPKYSIKTKVRPSLTETGIPAKHRVRSHSKPGHLSSYGDRHKAWAWPSAGPVSRARTSRSKHAYSKDRLQANYSDPLTVLQQRHGLWSKAQG